jgi:hypothetical protein
VALGRPGKRGKCRGIGGALPEVLMGKTAGQGSGSPGLKVPERHCDTGEVTGSNPVRPTIFFEILYSSESQNESQPPAVLSLNSWSERSTLRSTQETSRRFGALSGGFHRARRSASSADMSGSEVCNEFVLRLFLLAALQADEARALLARTTADSAAALAELREQVDKFDITADPGSVPPISRLVAEYGLRSFQAMHD